MDPQNIWIFQVAPPFYKLELQRKVLWGLEEPDQVEDVPDHGRGLGQDDSEGFFHPNPSTVQWKKDFCNCKNINNRSDSACERCQVQRGSILGLQLHGKND